MIQALTQTEQGSSSSQMTAVKMMDGIEKLPSCDVQAPDAVSVYIQVTVADASRVLKKKKLLIRNVQMFLDTSSTTHMANLMGQTWKIKMKRLRREYTLPRNEMITSERVDSRKHEDRRRYGIEIMIDSLFRDRTVSLASNFEWNQQIRYRNVRNHFS